MKNQILLHKAILRNNNVGRGKMERRDTYNERVCGGGDDDDVAGVLTRDGHLVSMCEPES
jgi:hypothetical protein